MFLPNLPKSNICFCRLGKNKAKEIKKNLNIIINKECILLDDYTQNLIEWESVGGVGIKRLTSVANNKSGKWKGLAIRNLKELAGVVTLV